MKTASSITPPALFVFDVEFTTESFIAKVTGVPTITDYKVTISKALTMTRAELWQLHPVTAAKADTMALAQTDRRRRATEQLRANPATT